MGKRSLTKQAKKSASASGAVGGPGTGAGLNYQIDLAIEETLDCISRALCAPHRVWEVKLEPPGLFGVSGSILAGSPGSSVSGGFSPLYQFGGSRSIQFSLKLKF